MVHYPNLIIILREQKGSVNQTVSKLLFSPFFRPMGRKKGENF